MVRTQAHRILLALTALAVSAGACAGAAAGAATPTEGDLQLAIDGSVHSSLHKQLDAPAAAAGLVDGAEPRVSLRVRTADLVLPNPLGLAARQAGALDGLAGADLVVVDGEAVTVAVLGEGLVVPWYYMMDDGTVRPYQALAWDTGTEAYLAYGEAVWHAYAAPLAPGLDPFPAARAALPAVRLTTAVDEVALDAGLHLALASHLAPEAGAGYARLPPVAAVAAEPGRAPPMPRSEALPAAAGVPAPAAMLLAAAGPTGAGALPAHSLAPPTLVGQAPGAIAFAGAAGLLAGAALYHLIRKSAILKNKVRSTIAEFVLHHPGATITEIAQAVGVTHQTASYHLRLLQEHGLVLGVERGNKRLYFRNDGSFNNEERGLVAVLRDPESMRVLDLIRANPWIMKNEAAAALGVSRNTLNWHLQKLLSAGLVSEARENGHCFLFAIRRASDELLSSVALKVAERRDPGAGLEDAVPPPPPAGLAPGGSMLAPPAPERNQGA